MEKSWTRLGHSFQFLAANFHWEVNPQRAELGAELSDSKTGEKIGGIFGLSSLAGSAVNEAEIYVRQTDLIVRYAATEDRPVEVSLMWRASGESMATLGLIISIQTDLLDAQPIDEVQSWFPCGSILPFVVVPVAESNSRRFESADATSAEHRCLVRSEGRLYLVVVQPSDLNWMSLKSDLKQYKMSCKLRTDNMEKGVIRRLRMQFVVGFEKDLETVRQAPELFLQSRLPLST